MRRLTDLSAEDMKKIEKEYREHHISQKELVINNQIVVEKTNYIECYSVTKLYSTGAIKLWREVDKNDKQN